MTEQPPRGIDAPEGLPIDPDIDSAEDARHHPMAGESPFPSAGVRPGRWPRLPLTALGVVFTGGVVGGLARYAVTSAWPSPAYRFPWATFVVNTAGTFALALLVLILAEVWSPHRYTRQLLGTGFLGAFTTFSSVVVTVAQLAAHDHLWTAVIYLTASLLAAAGAGSVGLLLGLAVIANRRGDQQSHPRRRR